MPKHYTFLLKRGLLILGIFTFLRLIFFCFNFSHLSASPANILGAFAAGLIFDSSAAVYCYSLFILLHLIPLNIRNSNWYQVLLLVLFMLITFVVVTLNVIDIGFYPIKGKRTGIELFTLLGDKSNPVGSYIVNYWYLGLIVIVTCFLAWKLYPRLKTVQPTRIWRELLLLPVTAVLLFLTARGGLGLKPIRSFDAARFVQPSLVHLTINTPFQMLSTVQAALPDRVAYMPEPEAEKLINPYKDYYRPAKSNDRPNVVVVILESFGRDYCGFLMDTVRFTPFLDSLSKQSLVFRHAYANGTTSIESVPAIMASVPSLMDLEYINSGFQSNTIHNVAYYLKQMGYDCSFYLGAQNGSMGFDNFLSITGQVQYFGLNQYPDPELDHDKAWGIWDEPYLQYYAKQLGQKKTPFFSTVFTLSSHDPYKVPEKYKNVFKGGPHPIHKTVEYTDMALKRFFETASKQAWFKNTMFIITADHASHSTHEYFYSPQGRYEIPIMIYKPGEIKPQQDSIHSISQTDIMATILDRVNYPKPFFSLGGSLLDSSSRHFAVGYYEGYYQLVDFPYVLRLSHHGDVKFFTQKPNTLNTTQRFNMTAEELNKKEIMLQYLKAYVQVYNNRLLDNTFY